MRSMKIALAAAGLSVVVCGQAWADDASEKALAKKVEELQKQLDEVSKRVGDGSNRQGDELEQRIAELEKVTKKDADGMFGYWKNGTKFATADNAFTFQVFGRIQLDFEGWAREEEVTEALGPTVFGEEFRRARIGVGGKMYKNIEYKAEYDFGNGTGVADFDDVYMQLNDAFCGSLGSPISVRVGHFDEPMGLDHVTSSKYTTFTERSLLETFNPARNTGIMVFGSAMETRLGWYAGWFRDANNQGNDTGNTHYGEENYTGRVTYRPYVNEDGSQFVHIGASGSYRNPSNEMVQYRSRPEVHQGPFFVDTGTLPGIDHGTLFGLEAACVFGAFHAQAEMNMPSLTGGEYKDSAGAFHDQEDLSFRAESVQVGYFLTGEQREWDVPMSRFDRIKVKKNYGPKGWGAWEVAARWSHIDLNDGDLESTQDPTTHKFSAGGEMTDYTFGINWYLNPQTKVMFDIVHVERDDLSDIDTVVVSFRIDF